MAAKTAGGAMAGVTRAGLRTAGGTARMAVSTARYGATTAAGMPGRAARAGRALVDFHPRRRARRVWTGHDRAHIEVRGLEHGGRRRERLATGVTRSLRRLNGVRWAEVNAVTGQVLLSFDERRIGVDRLLEAVRSAEKAQGVQDDEFAWAQPVTPGDDAAVAATAMELLVDCAAVSAAAVLRIFRLPSLPRGVPALVAALELERELRGPLVRRIGPFETDFLLSLVSTTVNGLSDGIGMPAVDAVNRMLLLGEARARRQVWEGRERDLCPGPNCVPHTRPPRHMRGRARPPGPVEQWEQLLAPFAPLTAASVLVLTGSPGRAADALLAAVPRAARYGREGFASAVGRDLARRGVVPLDPSVLRLLDLVSAIVIDSDVLLDGQPVAERRLNPLAASVLVAARSGRARVVLTDDDRIGNLLSAADQITDPAEPLADRVRDLQRQGEGVLAVSGTDAEALAAADVAVAVPETPGAEASWSADLVCAAGLEDVWRILRAVAAADPVSQRSVRCALAGSAFGTLFALVGRRRGITHAMTPVHTASLIALLWGATTGRRATRGPAPTPGVSRSANREDTSRR
ncbi:heavy-metal-associated domain-containing protein [Streptantibioticus rubrisoli]|uniref:Heavy-metal-associated domain-containing protein n=1 Tax=Streptantibioticus rubrisoli TaxID=1387313 RepID=A0ABT1PGX5_9ACTN|nr:heavy-metal-associated domain-containing protein [Streptantibioticus rubrisoli]MCQ4043743.1 heavy-metal-associated domain-containing protein [Streptantibioticus rubrisoli]